MRHEIKFTSDGGPADVVIALRGELTPTDFRALVGGLQSDSRFRAGLTLLVDISALEISDVGEEEIGTLTEAVLMRDWEYPPRAVAIIAPDEPRFKAARAYRAHLGGSTSKRHVVASRAEAVAWLEPQPEP